MTFPFLDLLPELRGEVRTWLEVPARAALARTCRALWAETPVPALPPEWRARIWDAAEPHPAVQRALIELVTFGVPQWPGAFRYADAACYCYRPLLAWHWAVGVPATQDRAIVSIFRPVPAGEWMLHRVNVRHPHLSHLYRARSLADLPAEARLEWQAFVASSRPMPDPWRWELEPFDRD